MTQQNAWPLYLSMLLAAIPDRMECQRRAWSLMCQYANDLADLAISSHDQGMRCLVYQRLSDSLREELEQLAEDKAQ